MDITINSALTRYYEDVRGSRQVVYFTLVDDSSVAYRMVDDLDAGINAATYLSDNIERQCIFVRRNEYKEMPLITPEIGQTQLQAIEKWIADGCLIVIGYDGNNNPIHSIASKSAWRHRWTDTEKARQQVIVTNLPSWAQVNTAVTNISNLTEAKAFIRKLARVVYWLAKNTEN